MRNLLIALSVVFFAACSTLRVSTDYDENYPFSKIKTYTIKHYEKPGENTLVNDRITAAIRKVLQEKGYKEAQNNADIIFIYHYAAKDKVDIHTDYQMIGIRRYGFGGTMIATTSTYEYTQGTIIIDALDLKTHKIVWRSTGTLELEQKETPSERKKYVYKIIAKLMEKFPSLKR